MKDLVLLDFLMPVMDGLDVARKFREWEREHRSGFHQVSLCVCVTLFSKHNHVALLFHP